MSVEIIRTAWGLVGEGLTFPDLASFAQDAADQGYGGIEFAVPMLDQLPGGRVAQVAAVRAAAATGLSVTPLIATRPERPEDYGDAALHLDSFRDQLAVAADLGADRAAVHGGADSFSLDQALAFFRAATEIAKGTGVALHFETHRGRPLNDPWRTRDILAALPELSLTSDLSHWMPVVDRWPVDLEPLFLQASRRAGHLHARVGHEKGPQVPDPRDPLWADHVALHRTWWRTTVKAAEARGTTLRIAPEFGPPPYMNASPFSQEPVADIVEVNRWMRDRLVDWFGGGAAEAPA